MDRPRIKTRHPGVYYRENKDGTRQYVIWYTGSDGKPRFVNVPGGERDAKNQRAKVVDRIAHGHKVAPTSVTFAEFARVWLDEQTTLKPRSLESYKWAIEGHLIPRLGVRTKLRDVDANRVAAVISDMHREGLKGNTIRFVLKPLNRMMTVAVRRGLIQVNPVSLLDRSERPKSDPAPINILDSDEIQLLLDSASAHWRPVLATAIFTGLRVSELLALTWDDVDWDAGVVVVRDSKTSAGRREVVLMDSLQQLLAAHSLRPHRSDYVFETVTGKKMDRRSAYTNGLQATLKKAGIEKRIRFHDLRHTFASILIGQGHDWIYIAEQMGHTNGAFTLRTYGHLMDREKRRREARARMQEEFGEVLS